MPSDRPDRPVLVLVSGLPGAGKTTHARVLERRLSAIRLSADDWLETLGLDLWDDVARDRIERLQWQLARRLLAEDVSVAIEWGTWYRAERDRIRAEAERLGARTELHHLDAPIDVLHQRVAARSREQPAIRRQQFEQWLAMFEVPTRDETRRWDHFETVNTVANGKPRIRPAL